MRTIEVSIDGGSMSRNGIITVVRGDSFTLTMRETETNAHNTLPILHAGDTLYFGLMEPHQPFEHALVRATAEVPQDYVAGETDILMRFPADKTEFLIPGTYYYAIKMKSVDSETNFEMVYTIRSKTRFNIID